MTLHSAENQGRVAAYLRSIQPKKDSQVTDTPTPAPDTLETEALEVAEDEAVYLAAKRRLEEATARYEATKAKGKPIAEVVAASNEVAVGQAVVNTAEPATGPEVDPVVETPTVDIAKPAPVLISTPSSEAQEINMAPVVEAPAPAPTPAASPIVAPEEAAAKVAVETAAIPTPAPVVEGTVTTAPVTEVAVAAAPSPPVASAAVPPVETPRHAYRPLKTGKLVPDPKGRKRFDFATSGTVPLMVHETAVFPTPLSDADEAAYLANPAGELAAMTAKYGAPTYETKED